MSIQLGDLPTWLAAIGTVGTLGAALWQINTERQRRLNQEAADRLERHREQARLISAVRGPEEPGTPDRYPHGRTAIHLINGSPEPVYRLVVAVAVQGTDPRSIERWLERWHEHGRRFALPVAFASILPTGTHQVWIGGTKWAIGAGFSRPGAEVAFTDRSGSHWIRRATGQLEELPEDPIDNFAKLGLHGPWNLQTPEWLQ